MQGGLSRFTSLEAATWNTRDVFAGMPGEIHCG